MRLDRLADEAISVGYGKTVLLTPANDGSRVCGRRRDTRFMNLMLGLPETSGLEALALYP
jgi:hypothetical protein